VPAVAGCEVLKGLGRTSPCSRWVRTPRLSGRACQGRLRVYVRYALSPVTGCPAVTDGLDETGPTRTMADREQTPRARVKLRVSKCGLPELQSGSVPGTTVVDAHVGATDYPHFVDPDTAD
jgi:hypothetical protein